MNGSAQKLIKYMDGASKRFIIPVYQRNYDWKMEHCKRLYDDLIKVIVQGRKSHFFGSVVSVQNENGTMEEFLIIDGQQRLTTVSLLLLAIYHLICEGKIVSLDRQLTDKILKKYLIDEYEPEEKRIKLKPIKNDQKAFGVLFEKDEGQIPDSNLTINYKYFYERIQREELSVDELFDAICKLEIINISLNHEDNPQLIFESLNSTGLDLSEGDKIRNYILMGLPNELQEKYYEKYWNKIEVCTSYDVSTFVRDYLSIKQQSTPNINSIYVSFKKYVEDNAITNVKALLQELLAYANRYEILLKANSAHQKLNNCIYRLNRLETTVTRPFFLEVLRIAENGAITSDGLCTIFQITENYIFRRTVCDLPTNSLNKIFLLLSREIIRMDGTESNYIEKFKYALLNKKDRARYPDDEEFMECLSTKNIYGMNAKNKLYLFERLENAGTSETKDVWSHLDKGDYSIEHIMPQHLTHSWIADLGEDYEQIHNTWLHRLANLTLTAYNSKYSNSQFSDKRDMSHGFKDSGLRMNQWICQKKKWNLAALEERNEFLKERAVSTWSYPSSSYRPQEKQLDSASLDEDVMLTGRVISKYSFKGTEQPVASWVDMYQQVISLLHSENKAILTKLAFSQDASEDLSLHFSMSANNFTSCKQIDENLFVWTAINTQVKISVLKKLFAMFNIEENELVFYLRDDNDQVDISGTRYEIRKKYWEYTLPQIQANFVGAKGSYRNVHPTTSNYLVGFIGIGGVYFCCVANLDEVRVELCFGMPEKEKNKALFDYLYERKTCIENSAGAQFVWSRLDENKISKIYLLLKGVDIYNETDWPRMAKFHVEGSALMYNVFKDALEQYFNTSL